MKNLSFILNIFTLVLKYGAVLMAVMKGLEVINEELKKINLNFVDDSTRINHGGK